MDSCLKCPGMRLLSSNDQQNLHYSREKLEVLQLKVYRRIRKTVLLWKQQLLFRRPSPRGADRLSTEPKLPCRRNKVTKARVLIAPFALTAATYLGHRNPFVVKQSN